MEHRRPRRFQVQGADSGLHHTRANGGECAQRAWRVALPNGKRTYAAPGAQVDGTDPATGDCLYFTGDHLESVRGVYDQSRDRVARYAYAPYGETIAAEAAGTTNRRFTGYYWEPESQSYFAPFRQYNPGQARWTTRDPLGSSQISAQFRNQQGQLGPFGMRSLLKASRVWAGAVQYLGK